MCKRNYIDCLIKEIGLTSSLDNPTYSLSTISMEYIIKNHMSVLTSFGISTGLDSSLGNQTYSLSTIPKEQIST